MATFGELLRRLRGQLSQRRVAEDLKMPVTTLSSLEHREGVPRGTVLKKLADYYGVPLGYFYSPSASEMRPSCAAKAWLQAVREQSDAKETVATHAPPGYPDEVRDLIARRIREKRHGGKASHGK